MSTQDISLETPSLFDAPPPATTTYAKDFVKWCCSFGAGFHNSPDVANLRYWAKKMKVKIKEREEPAVIEAAHGLFLKRIEQQTRKSEKSEAVN